MKIKTIDKVITKKIDDFISSIEDEPLRRDVKRDVIVTGGCIASMLLKEPVNDYDLYFRSVDTAIQLATYYVIKMGIDAFIDLHYADGTFEKVRPSNIKYMSYPDVVRVGVFIESSGAEVDEDDGEDEDETEEKPKYRPIFISENAITLSNKVQLVLRFTGTPEEIHSNYDFVHATNYWTYKTGVVTNKEALEALLARELKYKGSKYPLASIFRTRKFIKRGWNIHIGNYLKMAMQLNELDLRNIDTLRDQLTGVDAAYLNQIVRTVASMETYSTQMILTIIDRMMGEEDSDEDRE